MSRIHISSLRKSYGAARGVEHLDLDIREGEFFALLGPSGCGKTTALRCIAGLEEPDGGRISIGSRVVAEPSRAIFVDPSKRDIGMVFQSYALWPHLTVASNIGYPLRARKWDEKKSSAAIARALALVDLADYRHRYPGELSGGQQQRVAIARAIVASPSLILFDEPLSNLDAQLRIRLRQDLRRVHKETGHTAVYVTHDQTEALALADRIAVMRDGRAEQIGTPDEIFLSPRTRFVAEFVGYDNFFSGKITAVSDGHVRVEVEGQERELTATTSGALANGRSVWLAARSSCIRLSPRASTASEISSPGPANSIGARVRDVSYLGDSYQCVLSTLHGKSFVVEVPAEQWAREGAALQSGIVDAIFPLAQLMAIPHAPTAPAASEVTVNTQLA